jgi:hypothetical protein
MLDKAAVGLAEEQPDKFHRQIPPARLESNAWRNFKFQAAKGGKLEDPIIKDYPTKKQVRKMTDVELYQVWFLLRAPKTEAEGEVMDLIESRRSQMEVRLSKED